MPATVLVIATTARRSAIRDQLEGLGLRVVFSERPEGGSTDVAALRPEVVLLENHSVDGDPLDVCRRIVSEAGSERLPFIMLLPPEIHANLPLALAHGIQCLVGGQPLRDEAATIVCGSLKIDPLRYRATLNGVELGLTLTEFRLLATLAAQPGIVLSRGELCAACGRENQSIQQRTVDVHIKSIRHKLVGHAGLVETVRGVGYRLHEPTVGDAANPANTRESSNGIPAGSPY